jgi:hypothetical protein
VRLAGGRVGADARARLSGSDKGAAAGDGGKIDQPRVVGGN